MAAYNPVETYLLEAEELIADIEQSALSLAAEPDPAETINRLFRAFHTIKGSGAMCGLDAVADFTHHVETLLDRARAGSVKVSQEFADLLLSAADQIRRLLAAEEGGEPASPETSRGIIETIDSILNSNVAQPMPLDTPPPASAPPDPLTGVPQLWKIRFRPAPDLLACGGNPVLLFRDLARLGPCSVQAHLEDIPPIDQLQPDRCYLWWDISLETNADENAIRDVFIFVEDGSDLQITRSSAPPSTSEPENDAAPSAHPEHASRARKPLVTESTVRVPAERLDRLVNLVGELVMNQSRLSQAAALNAAPELANPLQEIERLVAALRDDVLGIRMLPIGSVFGRFRRVVHDLSAELGKQVDLLTEGGETELDKSILDQIVEPLVHLLRNSMDHGIESPEERAAHGKPGRGTIRLSAEHRGSDVVVRIVDDGRGINRAAVRAKAVSRQLIAPDAVLTDREIFDLLLLPGFSTAECVTSVSGRGVGMDAVKKQIDALHGTLSLSSEDGKGCRIAITLPLTLAIIDGLLVQVGADRFIIPLAAITENVELLASQRAGGNGRNLIAVRGELIPWIDLRDTFRIPGNRPLIEKIVIVRHDDQRVGLVVDRVLGTHQTVIQSLGHFLRSFNIVSGGTILGDGSVALILDISAVVRHADRGCRQPAPVAPGAPAEGPVVRDMNSIERYVQ